jgi:hypothetical protein
MDFVPFSCRTKAEFSGPGRLEKILVGIIIYNEL